MLCVHQAVRHLICDSADPTYVLGSPVKGIPIAGVAGSPCRGVSGGGSAWLGWWLCPGAEVFGVGVPGEEAFEVGA
jgi:hypothetical protein